jgi:DNA-directed RNA polymerase subunit beta
MQALGLDVKVLSENDEEVQFRDAGELDDDITGIESIMDINEELESDDKLFEAGYSETNLEADASVDAADDGYDAEPKDLDFDDDFKEE